MPKVFLAFLTLMATAFFIFPKTTYAVGCSYSVSYANGSGSPIPENTSYSVTVYNVNKNVNYRLSTPQFSFLNIQHRVYYPPNDGVQNSGNNNQITFNISSSSGVDSIFTSPGQKSLILEYKDAPTIGSGDLCDGINFSIGFSLNQCQTYLSDPQPQDNEKIIIGANHGPAGTYNLCIDKYTYNSSAGQITITNDGKGGGVTLDPTNPNGLGDIWKPNTTHSFWFVSTNDQSGVGVSAGKCSSESSSSTSSMCQGKFTVVPDGGRDAPEPKPYDDSATADISNQLSLSEYDCRTSNSKVGPCSNAAGQSCDTQTGATVAAGSTDHQGVQTAIGCVPTNPQDLIAGLLRFVLGISGGLALLIMAFGAIGIITSAGNSEALKASQERFYNAIIGLVFIILSVALLQIIGVDILQIPGFTR